MKCWAYELVPHLSGYWIHRRTYTRSGELAADERLTFRESMEQADEAVGLLTGTREPRKVKPHPDDRPGERFTR